MAMTTMAMMAMTMATMTTTEEFAEEVGADLTRQDVPMFEAGFSVRYRGYDVYFKTTAPGQLDSLMDYLEASGAKPVLKGGTAVQDDQAGETTFDCPQIRFSREDSGKYMIQFYKVLGDGSLSQWPEVKHTDEKQDAWEILEPVLTGEQAALLADLPAKVDGEWSVTFKPGRPTGNMLADGVTPAHYKDLVRFELRTTEE